MKTWTNPEIEELKISLTAGKGDDNHCEAHKNGNGHAYECNPGCDGWSDEGGTPLS